MFKDQKEVLERVFRADEELRRRFDAQHRELKMRIHFCQFKAYG